MDELGNKNESTLIFQSKNTIFSCTNIILIFSIVRSSSVYSGLSHTRSMGSRPLFSDLEQSRLHTYIYYFHFPLFTSIQRTEQSQVMLLLQKFCMNYHVCMNTFLQVSSNFYKGLSWKQFDEACRGPLDAILLSPSGDLVPLWSETINYFVQIFSYHSNGQMVNGNICISIFDGLVVFIIHVSGSKQLVRIWTGTDYIKSDYDSDGGF